MTSLSSTSNPSVSNVSTSNSSVSNTSISNTTTTLPDGLYWAEQVREHERRIAGELAIEMYQLMEAAGKSAFDLFQQQWPGARSVIVVCGTGNNGGDGYVFARLAKAAGLAVELLHLGSLPVINQAPVGDACRAQQGWLEAGGEIQAFAPQIPNNCSVDVIVDALLGTGFSGNLRTEFSEAIDWINASGTPVLSLDLPSGLAADTGQVPDVAVNASHTVTFVAVKPGLLTGQGRQYCGQVHFADLGIGEAFEQSVKPDVRRLAYQQFNHLLAARSRIAHKGHFKRLLLLGGESGMGGAISLASQAALRTGASLVSVATREEHVLPLLANRPELMVSAAVQDDPQLTQKISDASLLVVGPGLGQHSWGQWLWQQALNNSCPKVVDADGLNFLAANPTYDGQWILTPHPGEAARLLQCQVAEVEANRFAAVRRLQKQYGGVVVLKGAGTLVYDGQLIYLANVGNPGMASGGMGDLLSGIIGGLLAQGANLTQAACAGVLIHGMSGDQAAKEGERGLLASDLLPWIRTLVNPPPPGEFPLSGQ